VPIANIPTGTGSTTVCVGNDSRLSDARTPTAHTHPESEVTNLVADLAAKASTAHATSHKTGGSDAIKLDELAATTDVTTLNASASAHGLLPKLSNNAANYLNGQGAWTTPAGGGGSGNSVEAVVDFGENSGDAVATVAAAWVAADSEIIALAGDATSDHDVEDALLEELRFAVGNRVAGVSFDLNAHP
jgi:hypothetical protein